MWYIVERTKAFLLLWFIIANGSPVFWRISKLISNKLVRKMKNVIFTVRLVSFLPYNFLCVPGRSQVIPMSKLYYIVFNNFSCVMLLFNAIFWQVQSKLFLFLFYILCINSIYISTVKLTLSILLINLVWRAGAKDVLSIYIHTL